jgi:hypothetical protein
MALKNMKRFIVISALAVMAALGIMLGVGIPHGHVLGQGPAPATGVAAIGMLAQVANIASTPISPSVDPVIVAAGGMYRADCYMIETVAATTSSTLPVCNVIYTDTDTGNSHTVALTATSAANAVDTVGAGSTTAPWGVFHAKGGTTISFSTSSYASSGATAMAYSLHFRLEYIGK